MNLTTPFSGLSLIVHLVIIGFAKLMSLFPRKTAVTAAATRKAQGSWIKGMKIAGSHLIVVSIFAIMFASFGVAVKTGAREGAKEPHIKFIKHELAVVRAWPWQDLLSQATTQNTFEIWADTVAKRVLAAADH